MENLAAENINANCSGFEKFLQIRVNTLDIFAPCKKKHAQGNNMPFVYKFLTKVYIKRRRFRYLYLKKKTDTSRIAYIKHSSYCVPLLRKTKKDHYANLNEKDVADNKQFWMTVKPLLSDKIKPSDKITLVAGKGKINDDKENAEIFK